MAVKIDILSFGRLLLLLPAISFLLFTGLFCVPLFALDPNRDLNQFARRTWGERDGYPGLAFVMAQSADGFLWLGTNNGLYRFDGVHFERVELMHGGKPFSENVHSLLALPDGSLWVGLAHGKIYLLQRGRITSYGGAEGVPDGSVSSMVQDRDGRIWAATDGGLIRLASTRWGLIGTQWNCLEKKATFVYVDRGGTLWAAIGSTILYLRQGSHRFEETGEFIMSVSSIVQDPDGRLWFADTGMAVRPLGMPGSLRLATARCEAAAAIKGINARQYRCNRANELEVQVGAAEILFDRDGSLWIPTIGDGIRRAPHPLRLKIQPIGEFSDALEKFTSKDGLSSDFITSILEDREGNIWMGTRDGLEQFRDSTLVPVALPTRSIVESLTPDSGGNVWIVENFAHAERIHGDSSKQSPYSSDKLFSVYRDPAGGIWAQGESRLLRWKNGNFRPVAKLPGADASLKGVFNYSQIASDNSGTLWAFVLPKGFYSLDRGTWKSVKTEPEVANLRPICAFTDEKGRIWFGTNEGLIVTLEGGRISTYSAGEVHLGPVEAISGQGPRIWVAGADGMALFEGGRFRYVNVAGSESFANVTGIVDTGNGGLWLNEGLGVVHIPGDETTRFLNDSSYRVHYELFGFPDGLPGRSQIREPFPTAVLGTDGRIWFAASRGVAWVNPGKIARNDIPPPVSILSILADSSPQTQSANLRIPPRTENVQINYTALSLSVPERVRFRYKLDGIDKDWKEAGARREVLYSRLPPGRYTFHVIACNNDGLWNEAGANLRFVVASAWFQTIWFEILCALAVCAILWMAYTLRVRQVTAHIQERLGTRLEERERIARELHDTLLQGFQGLVLRFEAVMERIPKNEPARDEMENVLERADEVLLEGRNRVSKLRAEEAGDEGLPLAIASCGEELAQDHASEFRMNVVGTPQSLDPVVQDEAHRIGREALVNAFAHSNALKIEAEITYDSARVRLSIRDNGEGIDPEILKGGRAGHWGLSGMRERAENIGGQLNVWSNPGAGSEVELILPAKIAYKRDTKRLRWDWIKRVVGGGR